MSDDKRVNLSEAQAKRVAEIWSKGRRPTQVPTGYQEPTNTALIKRGVLIDSGERTTYPNGHEAFIYKLADDATDHLAAYLLGLRYKRISPRPTVKETTP